MSFPRADPRALEGTLRQRLIERLAEGKLAMPVLPGSSARVLARSQDPTCDTDELAALIRHDPALTSHVLRVANSVAYAPREPIVDLRSAIRRLGLTAFSGIVVGIAVREKMFRMRGFEPRLRSLWRHSAVAGVWSLEITRLRGDEDDGAFLAGLLHDVGKAVILQALTDLTRTRVESLDLALAEALMSEFHAQVGADLLAAWGLPAAITEAVRQHHTLEDLPPVAAGAYVVALADDLARWGLELGPVQRRAPGARPNLFDYRLMQVALDPAQHGAHLLARTDHVLEIAGLF